MLKFRSGEPLPKGMKTHKVTLDAISPGEPFRVVYSWGVVNGKENESIILGEDGQMAVLLQPVQQIKDKG